MMQKYLSALLGNLFEHYDAALFGFLSPFLAPFIFPEQDPLTALILTYAMIPLGMAARPLGALFFGYLGDHYGRAQALFWSLGGMSIVSAAIALSPTYEQAGILCPLIFASGRVLQNFLAAGESMGGAIFLLEGAEEKRHNLLSSIYNASTIGGLLLASFLVAILSHYQFVDQGWRWLYVLGALTGVFGCMIRRGISLPTPTARMNYKAFWEHRKAFMLIMLASGFGYANYSVALILLNGWIPLVSNLTKAEMITMNSMLLVLDFLTLPFFGWVASKMSREKLMLTASLGILVSAAPLFLLLKDGEMTAVILVRITFVLLGVAFFAPFHAWAGSLVPTQLRYTIISVGYALGSQLLGGPTAGISLWLFKTTGIPSSVAWYWMGLAFLSTGALMWTYSKKRQPYAL